MKILIKNLLILIATVSCSYGMEEQFDIIENWKNSYGVNDSSNANKILAFYSNKKLISEYLNEKIIDINDNGSLQLNTQKITKFDWDLFSYNIKHSASARANLQILLKEFSSNSIFNLEIFEKIFNLHFDTNMGGGNQNHIIESNEKELFYIFLYFYITCLQNGNFNIDNIQKNLNEYFIGVFNNNKNNLPKINAVFSEYYNKYYYPRLVHQNYRNKNLDNITLQDLNNAIKLVQDIDLAKILKYIIISINIGETLFNREN